MLLVTVRRVMVLPFLAISVLFLATPFLLLLTDVLAVSVCGLEELEEPEGYIPLELTSLRDRARIGPLRCFVVAEEDTPRLDEDIDVVILCVESDNELLILLPRAETF
jgi:hypothetical protein